MEQVFKPTFNKEYANKVSKAEFIKNHEQWAEKVDLGAEWDKLQVKKEKLVAEEKK